MLNKGESVVNIAKIGGISLVGLLMMNTVACSQVPGGLGGMKGSQPQKEQVESIVKNYILNNPEVLVQSLQGFQQKQMDEARKSVQKTQDLIPNYVNNLFHSSNDPMMGNPQGAITLVEFFDYQCPHCTLMYPVLENLIKNNSDVRIILKEFPIRGPDSELAARAALAAQMQGKYDAFHGALMKAGQIQITADVLYTLAASAGLDVNKLKADMNSKTVSDQLAANLKLGQDLQLLGTPAFFIAKSDIKQGASPGSIGFIPGQVDLNQLQTILKKARE